jgi:hypothetical protein
VPHESSEARGSAREVAEEADAQVVCRDSRPDVSDREVTWCERVLLGAWMCAVQPRHCVTDGASQVRRRVGILLLRSVDEVLKLVNKAMLLCEQQHQSQHCMCEPTPRGALNGSRTPLEHKKAYLSVRISMACAFASWPYEMSETPAIQVHRPCGRRCPGNDARQVLETPGPDRSTWAAVVEA